MAEMEISAIFSEPDHLAQQKGSFGSRTTLHLVKLLAFIIQANLAIYVCMFKHQTLLHVCIEGLITIKVY